MQQKEVNCSLKVTIYKFMAYSMIILNIAKYVCLDMPDIEEKLRERHIEGYWLTIWILCIVVEKALESFLSGYAYYFSLLAFITMIKGDKNIIKEIKDFIRLILEK